MCEKYHNCTRIFLFTIIANKAQYSNIKPTNLDCFLVLPNTFMEKRPRDRSPSGNPAPRKRRELQSEDSLEQSDQEIDIDLPLEVLVNNGSYLDFDRFRENVTTVFFKHYLVVDKTHEEAREIFYRVITHLISLRPVFHLSYYNEVTAQINIAFSDQETTERVLHLLANSPNFNALKEDNTDLGVNLETGLLERIRRDPSEEKRRSLYISPLNRALKENNLELTMEDLTTGLNQVLANNIEILAP